jgi:5-hydroxyisourate hydrolase-like protein (transthyretin family)
MVSHQKDARLLVVITDADTEKPIEGIPVSFFQKDHPQWNHISVKTNKKGEATATNLFPSATGGQVSYSVNFGGLFGYKQLSPAPFFAPVFPAMTTIRRHQIGRIGPIATISTTDAPHEVPKTE